MMEFPQKPPIDDRLIDFHFPAFQEKQLANGLTVLFLSRQDSPKVAFQMGIDFGHKYDPEGQKGAVELLARCLKKGTRQYTYQELTDNIEQLGGFIGIKASTDFFYLSGKFLQEHLHQALSFLKEILCFPAFPEQEVEKEKAKFAADLQNKKSSPEYLANRKLKQLLFATHPYSLSPDEMSIQSIQRSHLVQLHQQFISPQHSFLVIVGPFSFDDVMERVQKVLGDWEAGATPEKVFPQPKPLPKQRIVLVHRPNSQQTSLLLGNQLFPRHSPEFEKMMVANKILGGGPSSRLFMTLREKKGYTYGAYSLMRTHKDAGLWMAGAEVRPEVTGKALEIFFQEIEHFRNHPVKETELKSAHRYLIGSFPLQNETPFHIASLALQLKLYRLPSDYWEHHLESIHRVSIEQVQEVAQKWIQPDCLAIVAVGDVHQIKPLLTPFGEVDVVDVEDHPLEK